jgi:polysaccharide pyruvyl transferase WcaK-like protein
MTQIRKKIALCGTYYTESVGDALLFECVKYIYQKNATEKNIKLNFKIVDTYGRNRLYLNRKRTSFFQYYTRKVVRLGYKAIKKFFYKNKEINFKKYYLEQFKDCDLIVVAGGGLFKYSVGTDFVPVFTEINAAAKQLKIPVVYNALGVEGVHNPEDFQFKKMQKAFNKSVKLISCRERIDDLKNYFQQMPYIEVSQVTDTGIWAKEAFRISKSDSDIIGINPISPFFFNLHEKAISEEELLKLWIELILKIDQLGYKIQIFTNGNDSDYRFAKKVFEKVKKKIVNNITQVEATSPKEMMKNISKCRYIVANRLHTCICAYSLDIPVIGLAWNDKLLNWGKVIQKEDVFFDVNDFDIEKILDKISSLEKFSYDPLLRIKLKESINTFSNNAIKLLYDQK